MSIVETTLLTTRPDISLNAFCFSSLSREKSSQDEKMRFIKGNELKIIQVDFHSLK